MIEAIRGVIADDARITYALRFGSAARHTSHAHGDVDVALGTVGDKLDPFAIGEFISRLESAARRLVHLVLLDEAPPGLAYRIFREGKPLLIRDRAAFNERLARAILEYLDFKPVEGLFTRGVLRARHGR